MKNPVVLRIYKNGQLFGVKQFSEDQIVIGHKAEVHVDLDGDKISPIHAAIEERDSGWYVCDLGSEAGTIRNGASVLDAPLESGDTIGIGDYEIEFFIGAPKPRVVPPLVPRSATSSSSNSQLKSPSHDSQTRSHAHLSSSDDHDSESSLQASYRSHSSSSTSFSATRPNQFTNDSSPNSATERLGSNEGSRSRSNSSLSSDSEADLEADSQAKGSTEELDPNSKGAGAAAAGLSSRRATRVRATKLGRKVQTFAPPSRYAHVKDFVRPSKGSVIEVLVAWRERVISTHHFRQKQNVFIGSHPSCDIVLPIFASGTRKVLLLKIETQAVVSINRDLSGELVSSQSSVRFSELLKQNRLTKEGAQHSLALSQGEMAVLELNDQISVIVRYVSDSPRPLAAPLLDLTASEFAAGVLSLILVGLLALFMYLHTPPQPLADSDEGEETLRTAMIIVRPTPAPVEKIPVDLSPQASPTPEPTPEPVAVRATPSPNPNQASQSQSQRAETNLTDKQDPGKSANAAPNRNRTGPRALTTPKQGGAIKTAEKDGAQMQSKNRDVSKSGVFSVLSGGGANTDLAASTSGAGELSGLAGAATGRSGYGENRAGSGLGGAVKDTGVGGSGKALTGIAGGIGTQGRGSGNAGYGGGGLGQRKAMKIVTGGSDETYSGTIDREAIRRVVKANERLIRTCYERELNRNPDLFGKLVLSWEIGSQGRVVGVGVKANELGSRAVADCILTRLRSWKFPEPPQNQIVEVAYPFFFSN